MSWKTDKIASLKLRLAAVEKAITEVIENGVSYSLSGSHSVTMADLDKLRVMENTITQRIIRLSGGNLASRTVAIFDGGHTK